MRRVPTCLPVALAILIAASLAGCNRTQSAPPTDGGATMQPAAAPPAPTTPADGPGEFGTAAAAKQADHPLETPTFTAVGKSGGVPMAAASKAAVVPHETSGKDAAMSKVPN